MFFAGGLCPQTPRFFFGSVGSVGRPIGRSVGRPDRFFQKIQKNSICGYFWPKILIKSYFGGTFGQKFYKIAFWGIFDKQKVRLSVPSGI